MNVIIYNIEFFRKLKLREYINTQRSESNLVKRIKEKFCTGHLVLVYDEWSISKQMRNIISTPMIGLKWLLHKNVHFVSIILQIYQM